MYIFVFISDLGMGEQHGGRPLIITVRSYRFMSGGQPEENRANPIAVGIPRQNYLAFSGIVARLNEEDGAGKQDGPQGVSRRPAPERRLRKHGCSTQ